MEDESLEKKQLFLRTEILMNGYDAQEFSTFLSEYKGEEKVDLEFWTMEELSKAVESFKNSKILKVEEEQTEKDNENEIEEENDDIDNSKKKNKKNKLNFLKNILKRRQSSVDTSRKNINYKLEKNDKDNAGKNRSKKNIIKVVEKKNFDNIRTISMYDNIIERDDIMSDEIVDEENEDDNIIKCQKLEKNELTDKDELNAVISTPTTIKKNMFSKLIQYTIETNPVGFKTTRNLDDFEYLYEKIHLINPKIFNPILPVEKKDSIGRVYILNYYINTLIKNEYFRSLPIVYDFLTLPIEDWEIIKTQKYDKIKELCPINEIQNLEGCFNLEININEEKYMKIKNNINSRAEAFNKFNNSMNELINIMEKMSTTILGLSESLCDLKNKHLDNNISMNYLAHLEIIIKEWGEGYNTQKTYLNDYLKYIFKYMDKENNAFLKYYDNLKKDYDDLKSKMDKMKKNQNLSEKDKKLLKKITKESLLNKVNIYEEYLTLNKIQGERLEKLLIKFGANKEAIFSDVNSFYELVNVFNAKSIEEKQMKEKKLKEQKIINTKNSKEDKKNIKIKSDNKNQ